MIDDDEVTCPLPSLVGAATTVNIAYCHSLIYLARASSQIEKRLGGIGRARLGAAAAIEAVRQLDAMLLEAKLCIDRKFGISLGDNLDPAFLKGGLNIEQHLYINYAYMTTLLSIHTVLAYPWIRTLVGVRVQAQYPEEVSRSSEIVAKVSRTAVLLTENIRFKAHTSVA
jgi:hypothetical protein